MVTVIRTAISGANVTGGGVATLCFEDQDSGGAVQELAEAVHDFWEAMVSVIDEDVTFQVEPVAPRYAASNGALQQVFTVDGGDEVTGTSVGNSIPRSSQAMIRWSTEEVINGRLLKGRTYVPGLTSNSTTDAGGLGSTYAAVLLDAANGLLSDTNNALVVWHRPQGGSGGQSELVMEASVWSQFAVLRSRRD